MTEDSRPDDGGTPLRTARSDLHPADAPDDMSSGTTGDGESDPGEPGAPASGAATGPDTRSEEADRLQTGGP